MNHTLICFNVTLSPTRKLINAAIRAKCFHITIGSPRPDEMAIAPNFYHEDSDLRQREPMLLTPHTMQNCTANISVGDGGDGV